jgi:hypothetical protein
VGSSESKAKGSFGQKEFYFSIMGETALEEEPPILLMLISFIHTLHDTALNLFCI